MYRTHVITRAEQLDTVWAGITGATQLVLDTETEFREALTVDGIPGGLRVLTLGCRQGDGSLDVYVVDCRDVPAASLVPLLAGLSVDAWNANFDEFVLERAGLTVRFWWDAMLAEAVTRLGSEGMTWYSSLADATRRHLGRELTGKGGVQLSYDLTSDLTDDQVAYAAADVAVTADLAALLRRRVVDLRLVDTVDLELAARPVIAKMGRVGFPFDAEAWRVHLDGERLKLGAALERLAELTGDVAVPSWNPASDAELRAAFNTHATDAVLAFWGRSLEAGDRLDKQTLRRLGHPLADAVLAWREHSKVLSTYGENLEKFVVDGRVRPRYKQAVVSTGRLASFSPNGQNLDPNMKSHIRPHRGRVFVHADLSQAELRMLAQLSGEPVMREAFASGEDFHVRVAATMFGIDMAALRDSDPERFKQLRSQAKALSFGQVYGMAARALATTLSAQGVPTTRDDASRLLADFAAAFPAVHRWLSERDALARAYAKEHPPVDWARTLRLAQLRADLEPVRKKHKRDHGANPSGAELAAVWQAKGNDAGLDPVVLAGEIDAAFRFDAALVLGLDTNPIGFVSRTPWGRRRVFQVPVDTVGSDQFSGVVTNAVLELVCSDRPAEKALVAAFAEAHGLELPTGDRLTRRTKAAKLFGGTNRKLRFELLTLAKASLGPRAWTYFLDRACASVISGQANACRNHPIQGAVADVVLAALAELGSTLPDSAVVVMSVHDSIVVEVDDADADVAAKAVKAALEGAMRRACPDVVVVADCDIRASLADADVLVTL